ncbi:MAG TPA: transglutaminase domain-containing protein [Armatimonadota bacterium]|nr:transglutaminase domain-containing protein [Armatimonadota bacterium]
MGIYFPTAGQAAPSGATASTAARIAKRAPRAGEWWMGISLGGNKLGYAHVAAGPAHLEDRDVYRVHTSTWTHTTVLGYSMEQRVEVEEIMRPDLHPLRMTARLGSGGKWIEVRARYLADRVEVERRAGENVVHKTLPIPKGANLVGDVDNAFLYRTVEIGETRRFTYLNVVTLSLEDATTRILRREALTIGEKHYDTVVAETVSPSMEATAWLLEDGQPVQVLAAPGMLLQRETREQALSGLEDRPYAPERDLATQTAVQTEGTLDSPREVKRLRLHITGIPERRFVIADYRQRAEVTDTADGFTVDYTVDAETESPQVALTAAERAEYLADTAYVQTKAPEIRARAKAAVGDAQGERARVEALWRWVHEHMRAQGDIGLPRSALEVLQEPVGVCRDYATLYTALARAQGIPTRLCAGILYFKDRFYYHAWAESYAGGRWIPVDTTEPPAFVDATHIKFVQGDAAAMYGAVKVIGRLRAVIREAK